MSLNKKSVDDINVKGKRVLVRCDFNVPLKEGKITDETRIVAALPTIKKLLADGGKVILCSHLGKVKNGPNEGESLAPVAERLSEKLGKPVNFVKDDNVTGEAATAAVAAMNEGDVVLLQNTRFRGKEETKPKEAGEAFAKELADLADVYVCDAFGSAHRAHASVAVVTKYITEKGGENAVGYLMQKEIDFLGNAVENPVRPFVAILGGAKVADKLNVINNLLEKCDNLIIGGGLAVYTVLYFAKGGSLTIDATNLIFMILGILLTPTPIQYVKNCMEGAATAGGVIMQFPLYAGIQGMMLTTGLAEVFANAFVSISSAKTLPLWTFISAGIINLFIPSGGSQWSVQGPIMIDAAANIGADYARVAMACSYGDNWTNLIQPFWALPLLAVANLKAKDIMGYLTPLLIVSVVIIGAVVVLWPI